MERRDGFIPFYYDERAGKLDQVFAVDSAIGNPGMREILLRNVADAKRLRAQAQYNTVPQHERDIALYVLLYKEVSRGLYADFLKDLPRVRADAPSMSSASCSPSCSGLGAPASRAVSVSRAAMAVLYSRAYWDAGCWGSWSSTAAAM